MKIKTIKILMMAALLVLMGQAEAMASSTRITFQVPVRVSSTALANGSSIECQILHSGARIGSMRLRMDNRWMRSVNFTASVPVTVSSPRNKFQKGDTWRCLFQLIPAKSREVNIPRSTLEVHGIL